MNFGSHDTHPEATSENRWSETINFLRWQNPEEAVLTAIIPDGPTNTKSFPVGNDAQLCRFLDENNGKRNIYYSVNVTKPGMKSKAKKTDMTYAGFIHVDIDPEEGETSEAAKARILSAIRKFRPAPSVVVDSGNGIQALWRLEELIALNPEAIADIEARNHAMAKAFDCDVSTRNIDRIFRVPGTTNLPNKKKVRLGRTACEAALLENTGVKYPLSLFPKFVEGDESKSESSGASKVDVDALPVSDRIKNLIRGIDDPAHPYPSRSEKSFAVIIALVAGGCADEQISVVMGDLSLPIGAHIREQGDHVQYLKRQIAQARKKVDEDRHAKEKASSEAAQGDLSIVCVDDVEAKQVQWLWNQRIALGKLTIIAGMPDVNKSTLTLNLAACVTTGRPLPCGEGSAPLGSVIILSAEDDIADTVRPRLEVADADLKRVHVITAVKITKSKGTRTFDLGQDIVQLEKAAQGIGDVKLIVIDPISAYMGKPGKLDSYRSTDVRSTLEPLQQMAARCGAAIVGIDHLNKSGAGQAMNRVMGSVAFVAAARAVYVVVRDADEDDRRLVLPAKNNLGKIRTGLAFRVKEKLATSVHDAYPTITWEDQPVTITADEALAQKSDGRKSEGAEKAKVLLKEMLADRPRPQKEIQARAEREGITHRSLQTAKMALGIKSKLANGAWWWWTPDQEEPDAKGRTRM